MTGYDRPRGLRQDGKTALIDRQAGYYRALTKWEVVALLRDLAVLAELAEITEGKTPERVP